MHPYSSYIIQGGFPQYFEQRPYPIAAITAPKREASSSTKIGMEHVMAAMIFWGTGMLVACGVYVYELLR